MWLFRCYVWDTCVIYGTQRSTFCCHPVGPCAVQCVEKCYANSDGCLMRGNRRKCGVERACEAVSVHVIKACRVKRGKTPLALNLGTRWKLSGQIHAAVVLPQGRE